LRLFDTGFIIDLVNSDDRAVELARLVDEEVSLAATSVVSVHEYLFGIYFKYRRDEEELKRRLVSARNDLERFEVIPVTREVVDLSSRIQADLVAAGNQIGINDVYIASTALHYGLSLVTRNTQHFKRIPKLELETY
jgi:predicted nucleic acid-binding protein